MPFTPYPVPPRGAGSGREIPVEGTNQAILFSHLHDRALHSDGVEVPVTLLPDPRSGGYKVKWDYGVIGTLPPEFRQVYPQLERITASQLTPEITARVQVAPQRGGLSVHALLPEPQWAVPVNDPPEGLWTLLPQGAAMKVDVHAGADIPADELAALFQAQLLVELTVVNDRVTVLYKERVLGVLGERDSAAVREGISHFQQLELGCVARAFINGETITVECPRTEELDDAALEPEISPLPALQVPAFAEAPAEPDAPAITESSDGGWAVHIPSASFEAMTPAKIAEHQARKKIRSPEMPASPGSTEVFSVVPDEVPEPVQGIGPGGPVADRAAAEAEEAEERKTRNLWGWIIGLLITIAVVLLVWLMLSGGGAAGEDTAAMLAAYPLHTSGDAGHLLR